MADALLLIIILVVGIIGLFTAWLGYKKDKTENKPKAISKLSAKILILGMVVMALNTIAAPLIKYFKPKEELATKEDIERLTKIILEKPINPSIEEVESELEKEVKAALEKQKEKAIAEYQHGYKAYDNNFFEVAISHFQSALEIMKISSFYLALGNRYFSLSKYEPALLNYGSALNFYRKQANQKGEASALGNIGLIYSDRGDLDNALKYHQQALAIDKEICFTIAQRTTCSALIPSAPVPKF